MRLGSRRQLPETSPFRAGRFGSYHFLGEEMRGPAKLRTTQLMQDCLRMQTEDNLQHVCGFAGPPMFSNRIGFDWQLDGVPEPMHLFGRIFIFFMTVLCGGRGSSTRAKAWRDKRRDVQHREECAHLGIFEHVWPGRMERLSDPARVALMTPADNDIATMTRPMLERWLRAVGETSRELRVPQLKRRVMEIRRRINQPGDFRFTPLTPSPLPWRLTRIGFDEVDKRILAMVFPHKTESIIKDGKSFLNSCAATCKTSKKHLALFVILPTVLRGFTRPLRRGLRFCVLGWRLLEGQVYSFNECMRLNVEPGSRVLDPAVIKSADTFIVKGLAMTTGAVPPSTLVPYLHILGHYALMAMLFGILTW